MKRLSLVVSVCALALLAAPAFARQDGQVREASVAAHEAFLAGDALRGRGSATPDEAVAAAYVAAMFQSYGLVPAPGMDGYLQTAPVTRTAPGGEATLVVGDTVLAQGETMTVLLSSGRSSTLSLAVVTGTDPATLPAAEAVMIAPAEGPEGAGLINAAASKGSNLIIIRETEFLKTAAARRSPTRPSWALTGAAPRQSQVDAILVPAETYDRIAAQPSATVTFATGPIEVTNTTTTNAIGYLPGTDADAGVLLITAHLDHLGVRDGIVMPGANDDASGTTAVMELAHALSSGAPMKRGILFVAYGSEEIGGLGSTWFGEHPPVPLDTIVANLEVEMIGDQDPNLPAGVMMMTGYDRSNFGQILKDHGALIGPDPYPDQNFFARSDNYSLALKGIVAHTISGWAVVPTYHTADDTIANLDIGFMTRAIQSLVEPLRSVANSDSRPEWAEGGRPEPR